MFKLLSLCLLQFKFALVILGRPQFINEESEFFMNLQEFRNHQNQGTGDILVLDRSFVKDNYVMLHYTVMPNFVKCLLCTCH